jgi:REP element-mobilizing transposase RayT
MPNQVKRSRQQAFKFRKHGGPREGAGRKPTHPGRPRLRHASRPTVTPRFPVHVTKRVGPEVTRLRRFELCAVLRRAFVHGCRMGEFRICQFSIQSNHIHLICEANDNEALACGIQGWSVRVARGLNRYMRRTGRVFDDRYHVEILRTPSQTRHALCYVLQNARRHGVVIDRKFGGADPYSSAWWFDGWRDDGWRLGMPPPEMRTVAEPASWLLKIGWKRSRLGLLSIDELPPAGRPQRRRGSRLAPVR